MLGGKEKVMEWLRVALEFNLSKALWLFGAV
jgi:hypothetical protein